MSTPIVLRRGKADWALTPKSLQAAIDRHSGALRTRETVAYPKEREGSSIDGHSSWRSRRAISQPHRQLVLSSGIERSALSGVSPGSTSATCVLVRFGAA